MRDWIEVGGKWGRNSRGTCNQNIFLWKIIFYCISFYFKEKKKKTELFYFINIIVLQMMLCVGMKTTVNVWREAIL